MANSHANVESIIENVGNCSATSREYYNEVFITEMEEDLEVGFEEIMNE